MRREVVARPVDGGQLQYRALGFVTIASLVVAGILTYLAIAILGWTENYRLSLAGVAGLQDRSGGGAAL